jgi:hypothetical protein
VHELLSEALASLDRSGPASVADTSPHVQATRSEAER